MTALLDDARALAPDLPGGALLPLWVWLGARNQGADGRIDQGRLAGELGALYAALGGTDAAAGLAEAARSVGAPAQGPDDGAPEDGVRGVPTQSDLAPLVAEARASGRPDAELTAWLLWQTATLAASRPAGAGVLRRFLDAAGA